MAEPCVAELDVNRAIRPFRDRPWVRFSSFLAAIWLGTEALSDGRKEAALFLAVALAVISFVAAVWAFGRIRRTRAITWGAIAQSGVSGKRDTEWRVDNVGSSTG